MLKTNKQKKIEGTHLLENTALDGAKKGQIFFLKRFFVAKLLLTISPAVYDDATTVAARGNGGLKKSIWLNGSELKTTFSLSAFSNSCHLLKN
jgi:hypothetical protein